MTTTSPSFTMNPHFRIQVLLEKEHDTPTKEFKFGDLSGPPFDALIAHVFRMTSCSDTLADYNVTFKYELQDLHTTRWINFDSAEGLAFAFQSNQEKGYVFISASILRKGTVAPTQPPEVSASKAATKPKVAKKSRTIKPKAPSPRKSTDGRKISVDQKILIALKELFDLGITSPPRLQVALFSGYANVKSKSFANALSKLSKTQGLIEYPDSKTVRLTQAGIVKAGSVTPPTSNAQVHEKIKNLLKGAETKVFNQLLDGRLHVREQVAADMGFSNVKSKSFANSLSKMSSLGFLEYVKEHGSKKNMVRLTDIAFPLGRPQESAMSVVSNDDASDF